VVNIPDAAARERYVTQVPTHARLLALAKAWLGDEAVLPANLGLDSGWRWLAYRPIQSTIVNAPPIAFISAFSTKVRIAGLLPRFCPSTPCGELLSHFLLVEEWLTPLLDVCPDRT
jgi:hypothetical protein